MKELPVILAAIFWTVPAIDSLARTWSDAIGKHKIEAELIDFDETTVRLRKRDGKVIEVPLAKLGDADQQFVHERRVNTGIGDHFQRESSDTSPDPASDSEIVDAGNYEKRLEKGVELYSQGQYSAATVFFRNLIGEQPRRQEAYLWLGHTLSKELQWAEARDAYKQYLNLAPNEVEGPRGIARAYEEEGNRDLARLWYKNALVIAPRDKAMTNALSRLDEGDTTNAAARAAGVGDTAATSTLTPDLAAPLPLWRQGIAGLLGARSVWWGRLIAIFIFVGTLVHIGIQSSELRRRFSTVSPAGIIVASILSSLFGYAFYWGVPYDIGGWGMAIAYAIAAAVVCRSAMAEY